MKPWLRKLVRRKAALIAAITVLGYVAVALLAPLLVSRSPNEVNLLDRMKPPGIVNGDRQYLFGTDSLGRDVRSRVVYGSRVSLGVGLAAVMVAGCLGVSLGLLAGYRGGLLDNVLGRVMDIQLAFPTIVLAITAIAFLRPSVLNVVLVLGVAGWVTYARVVRAETLALRSREFVEAARAIGSSDARIIVHYILPNIMSPVLVIGTFSMASAIIAEASLSFLGLGVPPQVPSWGGMLAEAREHIQDGWWLATAPGIAIVTLVLAIHLLGDWLRDWLDPRIES
jgi:peptide/nickel transport system permease protein